MKKLLTSLIIYGGGHYFYVLSILEPSLIHYGIAWMNLLMELSKVAEHLNVLWLLSWWVIH